MLAIKFGCDVIRKEARIMISNSTRLEKGDSVRFVSNSRYSGNNIHGPFKVHNVVPNGPNDYHVSLKDKKGNLFLGDSSHGLWNPLHLEFIPSWERDPTWK